MAPRSSSLTPGSSVDGGTWQEGTTRGADLGALAVETSSAPPITSTVVVRSSGKDSDDRRGAWVLAAMNSFDDEPFRVLHNQDEGSDSVARKLSGVNPIALQGKGETYVVGIVDVLQECVYCFETGLCRVAHLTRPETFL